MSPTAGSAKALIPLLALASAPARAQPPNDPQATAVHRLEPAVVTASREPQTLERSPGTVTVITREEIERARYTSVVDVLRHVPGVHIDQAGSRGSRASIYTRGLDPNQTLVLIDGVRMNDPTNNRGGSFDFSTLDPAGIERIEVVRGPLSAVHGSDAIAGVVHIITRNGRDGRELRLDASGGRWGVYRVAGAARGRRGIADLSLAGAWVDEGDPPDGQRYRGGNLKTAVGLELPAGVSLRGSLRLADSQGRAYPDDSGGPEFASLRGLEERDVRELDLNVEAARPGDGWLDAAVGSTYRRRRERRDSPGVAPGIRDPLGIPSEASRDLIDSYSVSLRNTSHASENLSFTLGGDVYREEGSSDGELFPGRPFAIPTSFDLDRLVGGTFGEVQWSGAGLSLYGGLRADFPDSASPEVTPRVSVRYRVPGIGLLLSGSWGRGFKLPSFFALASPVVGNPALAPERSQGWDLGVAGGFWEGRVHGRLTYFDLEVEDLVDFEPGPPPRLVNRSRVVSRGFELETRVRPLDSLDLAGHVTFTATDIAGSGAELLDRPRWQGDLRAIWTPRADVVLRIEALFVGRVKDSSIPTGPQTLDAWARVDLSAFWQLREHLTLYLEVDNLFDADYEEAVGFPAPGIRPRVGVEWRL